ncbi:hypothetical protein BsIDN1_49690 [Bacillus safensis]|uniref:Glutamate racemase n=1 Tax=Bacillus safensis TaxID=561879 RepID=A0A5S9MEI9_BACIA|nr:hypothetical protein BsIDN1_49690 [Bacillus safensis]
MKETGIDTLILGCTHYPILKEPIQRFMGSDVSIISSGDETAREASTILSYKGLLNTSKEAPVHTFYTTGQQQKIFKTSLVTGLATCQGRSKLCHLNTSTSNNPLYFEVGYFFFYEKGLILWGSSYT